MRDALRSKGLKPRLWRDPVFLPAGDRRPRDLYCAEEKRQASSWAHTRRRTQHVTDIATCLVADPGVMELRRAADDFARTDPARRQTGLGLHPGGRRPVRDRHHRTGRQEGQTRSGDARGPCRIRPDAKRQSHRLACRPQRQSRNPRRGSARCGRASASSTSCCRRLAFLQPTQAGQDALVGAVMELLPRTRQIRRSVSGCGTFTGPMLGRGPVDAYESVAPAIRALDKAKGTRRSRPCAGICFSIRCAATRPIATTPSSSIRRVPGRRSRRGRWPPAERRCSSRVLQSRPFARDARILVDGGYRLDSVRVVDQFTWSHHVELVAAFTKRPRGPRLACSIASPFPGRDFPGLAQLLAGDEPAHPGRDQAHAAAFRNPARGACWRQPWARRSTGSSSTSNQ